VIPTSHLAAFCLAAFVLIIVPGPSVLFVISRALTLGRRAAIATVVGNAAGQYVQVVVVAVGLGEIVKTSVLVFDSIKLVGVVYLIYLGVRTFRDRRSLAAVLDAATTPRSRRRIMADGFVVGISNPKSVVFFAAILPQFVEPASGHAPVQFLMLGLVFLAIALMCDSTWGLVAGTARSWFARSPRRLELIGGAGGLAIIGLGMRMALTRRRD
jgi:threonine/homoserine/homoserine lactone efflux protein